MTNKIKIRTEHTLHDLTGISQTVMPLVKQLVGNQGVQLLELLKNWLNIVGPELAQYTLPNKLSFKKNERTNGCLTLVTTSGAFAVEIKQRQKQIIDKVNIYFGYTAINSIKILQTGNAEILKTNKKNLENMKKNVVSDIEENYITELTENITSPQLREILQRLGCWVSIENK